MSKIIFGGIQPNPKEAKMWLHPHDGLKTYNLKKQEWTGSGSSNDAPTDEPESLYEFVDLGLPSGILWATTNVGANSPEEYGLYFAWGETEGYEANTQSRSFNWDEYKYTNDGGITLSKYNSEDKLNILLPEDDAAYQSDNSCRTPNINDFVELINNTDYIFEYVNGIKCAKFVSKINNNYIVVPFGGSCYKSKWDVGESISLMANNINENYGQNFYLYITDDELTLDFVYYRASGWPIRPIQDPK